VRTGPLTAALFTCLLWFTADSLSPSSQVDNVSRMLRFIQPSGNEVSMLKSTETEDFLNRLKTAKMCPTTITNYVNDMTQFVQYIMTLDLPESDLDFHRKCQAYTELLGTLRKAVARAISKATLKKGELPLLLCFVKGAHLSLWHPGLHVTEIFNSPPHCSFGSSYPFSMTASEFSVRPRGTCWASIRSSWRTSMWKRRRRPCSDTARPSWSLKVFQGPGVVACLTVSTPHPTPPIHMCVCVCERERDRERE